MTANIVSIHKRKAAKGLVDVSDEILIRKCADGNEAAQSQIFRRYHAAVHTFVKRLSGTDESELDDMVQQTFIEVFRSAGNFEFRSQVKSWIFAVASNVARRYVRSSFRRNRAHTAYGDLPSDVLAADAHAQLENRLMLIALETAVEKLSYRHRVVFLMCDVEGIPGVEAAKMLKIKEGTLWSRLHDARKKLARQLGRKGVR